MQLYSKRSPSPEDHPRSSKLKMQCTSNDHVDHVGHVTLLAITEGSFKHSRFPRGASPSVLGRHEGDALWPGRPYAKKKSATASASPDRPTVYL